MKDMDTKFGHTLFTLTKAYQTKIQMMFTCNHFYEDIYAGAILGVIITTLHYSLAKKWLIDTKQPWLQFSFIDSFLSKKTK
jgi:hypothetical protein